MKNPLIIDYVGLWKDDDTDKVFCDHADGFVLDWASNRGFGLFSFSREEHGVYVGDECMGLKNVKIALDSYCFLHPVEQWPILLKEFGSAEALMAAVTDWESKPREL